MCDKLSIKENIYLIEQFIHCLYSKYEEFNIYELKLKLTAVLNMYVKLTEFLNIYKELQILNLIKETNNLILNMQTLINIKDKLQ